MKLCECLRKGFGAKGTGYKRGKINKLIITNQFINNYLAVLSPLVKEVQVLLPHILLKREGSVAGDDGPGDGS